MKYQRLTVVEARQYDGPKLTVVNDESGEQIANAGDYLLGTEKGKISVMSAAKFEKDFSPCESSLEEQLATADVTIATLTAELEAVKAATVPKQ